jgi:hypothetical protein
VANLAQIAYPALSQRNALDFIQVVDLCPYLVEADELNHDLLRFLDGIEIGVGIVLNLMDLLDSFFAFGVLLLFCLFLEFFLDLS